MQFDIITIFPKIFNSYLGESVIKRARKTGKIKVNIINLRDFSEDSHKTIDDKPYSGGAGMVLMAEPILKAVDKIIGKKKKNQKTKIVVLSAKGKQFNQKIAYDWSKKLNKIIFVTGRYEGIDERVVKALNAEEISIGPYITMDGDVATMVIVSALTRLIPNVINWSSLEDESFMRETILREAKAGKLEYPHYTRPEVFKYKNKKYAVPKVLLSGDHKKIEEWRQKQRKFVK